MKNKIGPGRIFPFLFNIVTVLITILLINRDHPYVGHDYRFFISRLIDTDIFVRLNGWSVQWYTPSFGGGLPAFPNPQHLEYSILQWLTYFFDPWTAILITTVGVSFIGYYFFYRLLHDKLALSYKASTLGAMFFTGNGFYFEHMIVGHIGFQLFPLAALILYLLIDTEHSIVFRAVAIALLTTGMIYHAGFIIMIIIALCFSITLPGIYIYRPTCINLKQLALTVILALILAISSSSSKLYAVFSLMQHFPRHVSDSYEVGIIQAIIGIALQLFGVMTLLPIALIVGIDTDLIPNILSHITGSPYGIWELDTALSPVLLFFLIYGLAKSISRIRKRGIPGLDRRQLSAVLLLIAAVWINTEMTLAQGWIYSFTKQLPIIRSLHVNVRFSAALILPLTILGAIQSNHFLEKDRTLFRFIILAALTIGSFLSYFLLNKDVHFRYFNLTPIETIDFQIKNDKILPVCQILNIEDSESFLMSASSYQPYEALFGYDLENFAPETHIGSVFDIENGYYNMTNPVSLVFPEINHTYPFERIKVNERDKLVGLLQWMQPDWRIPTMQIYLHYLSVATFHGCLVWLLIQLGKRAYARVRLPHTNNA